MPGYDGAGPMGAGPMTGGGRGFCAASADGARPRPFGRGFFGRGLGRGCRNMYYATGLPRWARGINFNRNEGQNRGEARDEAGNNA